MIEITEITDVIKYSDGIEAMIFDLDDTLYPEKSYVRSGYKVISEEYPHIDNMQEKLWNVFLCGGRAIDEVLEAEGILSSYEKEKCLNIYRFHKPEISFYDGVYDMLISLRKRGKKIGIITDGRPEGQRAKIEALGLENLVDEIIVTDELGGIEFRKPNSAAFEKMQKLMNVSFYGMAYVGDNIKKDFVAPEKLGMRSIHFVNKDGLYY